MALLVHPLPGICPGVEAIDDSGRTIWHRHLDIEGAAVFPRDYSIGWFLHLPDAPTRIGDCSQLLTCLTRVASDGSARRSAARLFTPPAGAGPSRRCTRAGSPWMPSGMPHKKRARLLQGEA